MRFLGKIHPKRKGEKYHSVEISDLGIYTQGKDIENSLFMAQDALEELIESKVEIHLNGKNTFTVTASDLKPLVGRFLQTMREISGLTIREVTERLDKKSPNYYAQYEQGKSLPSMEMISEFLKAISPETDVVISTKKVS
jgi:hypothetical protein